MSAVRILFLASLAWAMTLSPQTATLSSAASASLRVSATLLPWLDLSVQQNTGIFRVSETDLSRGYLDLPGALTVRLRTNIPGSIVLRIAGQPQGTTDIQMATARAPGTWHRMLQPEGLEFGQPRTVVLNVRLILAPETLEGEYPLQATIAAEAYCPPAPAQLPQS